MKKKISVFFLLIVLLGVFCLSKARVYAFADNNELAIDICSKSAYLIEPTTKTVIYKKDENKRLPIASMCKIMTLLLCFEKIDNNELSLDEKIVVSETASGMGGSQVFLETGGEYSVGELIKSIVVSSANDACVAMAEKIAGNEESFIDLMNEKASKLQMNNTAFINCTGLPKEGQYSCAKDVATMFMELIKHDDYFKFSRLWTDKVMHPNDRWTEISNTNKLIRFYEGCDSGKTGYTSNAGHCLCASAKRNGLRLVSVVISSPDSKTRFKEVSSLFNYGFNGYESKVVIDNEKPLSLDVNVLNGKKDKIEILAEESFCLLSKKNQKRSVEIDFVPNEKILAPIKIGDKVGELIIYENGVEIGRVNVLSNENVNKKTYFDYIVDVSKNWALI